ncbi:glycosyltransferase family 4 protein [Chloroflexus sp.]|uniref:glycosyltransferase family 4 protein n=1 Tax=Chloroflexus sp. TaxID=1904827 RepID=UPI0026313928|nr:glycosyltransferase family 4 protein [uncultured Chloroflexus sp.]
MRIVFLLPMGLERPSGRRYFNIARGLVRRGFHARLLALHPDLAMCRQRRFMLDGVEVWYVGQMHARKSGSTPTRFGPLQLGLVVARSTLAMVWAVLCSPADWYHLGKPQPINGLAALLAVWLWRRQPFLVDCDDDEVTANRFTAAWQRAVFAFWQWLLPRLAAGITTNTRYLAQKMARPGQPCIIVPNGVDCATFTPPTPAARIALARVLGIENQPVIAYAGTLALHSHPVDLLLEAFAQVLTLHPTAVLLLIGGGEDLPQLQRYVAQQPWRDQVRFTGHVAHNTVRALLSLADLSVDPVYDDTVARARSPLKLMESLALGVPVVTGDVGDRAEMLGFGAAGMVVRAGDPAALAAAISDLLADPDRRAAMSTAAKAQARRYDWDHLAERWADIYRQIATAQE